jgi:heat-inducible transcriptional repressor
MLDDRKTAILRAVVQEYIETGQPVGSGHIAHTAGVSVSSATVRNDMAMLEQEGYLVQPHTSAGRIPTDKGYRFFVDTLVTTAQAERVTSEQVGSFFNHSTGRVEELLQKTSGLLTNMTNYAALVVGPAADVATVRSVQIVRLSLHMGTVVVVLSSGVVQSEAIDLDDQLSDAQVAASSAHLNAATYGHVFNQVHLAPSGDVKVDALCSEALSLLVPHQSDANVIVGGAAAMAQAFDAVDVVRSVLQTLEQQYVVVSLVRDVLDRGLSVAIGSEHGVEPLAACSVVVAPVMADGEKLGTVGVLGPTRMNYPQALATVEAVSTQLGRRLADGSYGAMSNG